jgi:alpha-L-fucosidase
MKLRTALSLLFLVTVVSSLSAQDNKKKNLDAGAIEIERAIKEYYPETDPLVLEKLEQWRDLKFGLLMHWGAYSQWGVIESWSICAEDEGWCQRPMEDYIEYKKQYENLKQTFNPVKFNPDKWAEAAKDAGMKYVVFTTKHHDGFCMFDTKYTDYKITDTSCAFHSNPKANVTKEILDAFRKKGFWAGTYFSKPDWHSNYFWWKRFATPDRNPNYDIEKYPDRWQKFVEYTHNQIDELMSDYGKIDILWLDGGWIRHNTPDDIKELRALSNSNIHRIQDYDINMPLIAKNARTKQPGLIVVDRAVPGPLQNYLTPENQIPDKTLPYPWETCMPMAGGWAYNVNQRYIPAHKLVHLLIDIVSKGGNLLLNIGPTPDGEFAPDAYDRLKKIGEWMKINGEAIYSTRPVLPYKEGKVCFTESKSGSDYLLYLADEDEVKLPEELTFQNYSPKEGSVITILGTGDKINWTKKDNGFVLNIPKEIRNKIPCNYAWVFKITK